MKESHEDPHVPHHKADRTAPSKPFGDREHPREKQNNTPRKRKNKQTKKHRGGEGWLGFCFGLGGVHNCFVSCAFVQLGFLFRGRKRVYNVVFELF